MMFRPLYGIDIVKDSALYMYFFFRVGLKGYLPNMILDPFGLWSMVVTVNGLGLFCSF